MARQKGLQTQDIEKMKKLRNLGYIFSDIAKRFNVSETTVRYHLNPIYKGLILKSTKKRRQTPEGKEWQRKYYMNRYRKDKNFRQKHIDRTKRYQQENPEKKKETERRYREKITQKKSQWSKALKLLAVLVIITLIIWVGIWAILPKST